MFTMNKRQRKKFNKKFGYKLFCNAYREAIDRKLQKLFPGQPGIFAITTGIKMKAKRHINSIFFLANPVPIGTKFSTNIDNEMRFSVDTTLMAEKLPVLPQHVMKYIHKI